MEDIVEQLKKNESVSIFETQVRCEYKKPEFVAEYGELYQKPLHAYLKGKGYNDDVMELYLLQSILIVMLIKRQFLLSFHLLIIKS